MPEDLRPFKTTAICLGLLFGKKPPKTIRKLIPLVQALDPDVRDYDVRRAMRTIVEMHYATQKTSKVTRTLYFSLTARGRNRVRRDRKDTRILYARVDAKSKVEPKVDDSFHNNVDDQSGKEG